MSPSAGQTDFTRQKYDTASKLYDWMEWPMERLYYQSWRQQLWRNVSGDNILEIGVGTGKNIPYYPKSASVTAIDLSSGMLHYAQTMADQTDHSNMELKQMDIQDLAYSAHHFDAVVGTFVFCSVPDPMLGLQEALRVTQKGGRLYLLEHMRSRSIWLADLMNRIDDPIHRLTGIHIARDTVNNVTKAGWELDSVQDMAWNGIFRKIEAHKPN